MNNKVYCYQCDKPINWLVPDGRCGFCTRYIFEQLFGNPDVLDIPYPKGCDLCNVATGCDGSCF